MKKYLALFLVISSLGLSGCGQPPKEKEKPVAVSVQMAKGEGIENANTFTGTTKVKDETSVTVEMGGTIEEIYVTLGQEVKKGDTLLTIKGDDTQNSVKQLAAALEIAKANYTNTTDGNIESQKNALDNALKSAQINYDEAKRSYNINTQLYQAEAISEDAYKKYEVSLNQAKQNLDAAQKSYDTSDAKSIPELKELAEKQLNQSQVAYDVAASNLNKLTLTAPTDGIITVKNFNVNEMASQQKPAFVISSPNTLQIDLDVTQSDLTKFTAGQEVSVMINNKATKGIVRYVPTVVNSATSLYDVEILVDNSQGDFKAGMSADIEVSIEKQDQAITVPKKAIFEEDGKKYVYIASSDNKSVKTEVTTGIVTSTTTEIKSGISKDDTVVIGGLNLISDGTSIFPVTKED
ncbi:MAG: efflux RND transporter periplasmic adaptor subunit [Clostridium sp.]|uniref:efflux RND transporter periplasmic adaptor subunit n=1 Tax=Clostridium sp. TaxID=1506 RepID=UPI0025C719BE|nr:efflux RND transporter periplasmic adaptor subunit [Clostridium sp.]MCE5221153.1 efflux RND transporter periplasmic adaptor subunit [Clostridium sp.]